MQNKHKKLDVSFAHSLSLRKILPSICYMTEIT